MFRIAVAAILLGTAALPAAAAEKAAEADVVVARVNGKEIRRSEVLREMETMGPQAQQMPIQLIYPQLLQRMIITKLVAAKGYEQKLQNDHEVKERLKDAEAQIVADMYVRRAVKPKVTEEKIKARYNELVAKFKPEDEVRARHILVPTEAEANEIIKQIKEGADFAKIASEKSKDSGSSKQGGDLGYFTRDVMVKPFAEAAFAMKTGEISEKPVKTDFGYHIIKLEDRRKSSPPPLSEVKEHITNQVGQEMVNQLVKEIEAKAKIEKFNLDGSPMKSSDKAEKTEKTDKTGKTGEAKKAD